MSRPAIITAFLDSEFCLNRELAQAVIDQLGTHFVGCSHDLVNGGFDKNLYFRGEDGRFFRGFIYYHDTIRFALTHRDSIGQLASNDAQEVGLDDKYSFFAGFKATDGLSAVECAEFYDAYYEYDGRDDFNTEYSKFWNALAWYAAESVSRWFVEFVNYELAAA
jgi:hypothetical protein